MAMTARFERFDVRLALIAVTAGFYALTFGPLYDALGPGVVSLSVVPVALAGWLFGLRAGLLAGAVAFRSTRCFWASKTARTSIAWSGAEPWRGPRP